MTTAATPLAHPPTAARLARHRAGLRRRAALALAGMTAVVVALLATTMLTGSYAAGPWEVLASALHLRDDPAVDFVVRELRLPTALTGLLVGAALGVAGLLFQRLLANPLASPDFVGVSSGASLFAVAAIVVVGAGAVPVPLASLAGALVSAALVYVLAWRDGISGYRFILIGIGVSEFMLSLVGYVIARADMFDARAAMTWLVGSVGQAGTAQLRALAVAVVVLVPAALVLSRALRTLELGDDAATALGARVEPQRLAMLGIAIVLVAFATAAAGPILFVALIAGPVAVRLTGPASSAAIAGAALVGASIVLGADLIARYALPVALPTGVVTGAVGAPYLVWLLVTANREGRGG